jgi:CHAD domain-containing protein
MAQLEVSHAQPDTRGIRHIARQRIEKAVEPLHSAKPTDQAVHTARKELKKARATLRLLRDALSDATYKRENVALRDAARPLGAARDAKALITTLDKLVERYGAPARALPVNRLKRALRRERSDARRRMHNGAGSVRVQRAALRKSSRRAANWPTGRHGWDVIGKGLKRTYRNGRKALAAAESDESAGNFHEWRKQTKYLWHQLRILEPMWPGLIGELADQTHKLADYLGDDHDLAVLRERILGDASVVQDAAALGALIALIDRRRSELQGKAFVLGRRIYEEKPKVFAARFGKYWQDWKAQPETGTS